MFNEKEYIQIAIEKASRILDLMNVDYELIVVDDASSDGSEKIIEDLAKYNDRIKVFHHKNNRKLGGALKTGFSKATKDIIVYTDVDLPFDLSILKEAAFLIRETDIIQGYRIGSRESIMRVIYSKVYNSLIKFIFGLKIKDVNFSMKIFRRVILNHINLKSEGSFINAEFLIKSKNLGYKIKEIGVNYQLRGYGVSRLSSPGVILKILFELIKLYPEVKKNSSKIQVRLDAINSV